MRTGKVMFRKTGDLGLSDGGHGGVPAGSDQAKEIIARIAGIPPSKLGPMRVMTMKGRCIECGQKTGSSARRCPDCNIKRSRIAMGSLPPRQAEKEGAIQEP